MNFDGVVLLNVYSNSFIFGTQHKGWLLLVLSHRAGQASGGRFAVRNDKVTFPRLESLSALLLVRALHKNVSENGREGSFLRVGEEFTFSLGK